MLIAQLTDLHVRMPGHSAHGGIDTAGMAGAAMDALLRLDPLPDLLVLTGDLVDGGTPEEYAVLRAALARLSVPVLMIPGNHDRRDALRAAFPTQPWPAEGEFLHYAHETEALRIVALDTVVAGEEGGALCERRLAWLDACLEAAPNRPTLILMHHPPFETGMAEMDRIGLAGREAFAACVLRHPQIALIACGHLHRHIESMVGGRRALTCPSTAHQLALDLRPAGAGGFTLEPPGFMLHRWDGEGFVSHLGFVDPFPGPFAFGG